MKRLIAICCVLFVLTGCVETGPVRKTAKYPNPETPEARALFEAVHGQYISGDFREADANFARLVAEHPYTELTDRARFYRGEMAFSTGNYDSAIAFYRQAYGEVTSPNVAPLARFKEALALFKLGRPAEALAPIGQIDRRDASAILHLRIDSLGIIASKASGRTLNEYIIWELYLLDDYAAGAAQNRTVLGARANLESVNPAEIVPESDALADVRKFVDDESVPLAFVETLPIKDMKGKRSGGYVEYKKAYIVHRSGDSENAMRLLKSYISSYPKHEYYSIARVLMSELGGAVGEAAGIKVGVMLPLSGKYSTYGESVLHGIECATGIYDPCSGPAGMMIIVRDSANPQTNAAAIVDELAEQGVVAIIGPLLSKDARDAALRSEQRGIPMISLAQLDGIAEMGDYIFRNSVTASSEVGTLVDYVFSKKKMKRFYILYPDNKKGLEYRDLFTGDVEKLGGKIVGKYGYAPNQMEFGNELRGRGSAEKASGFMDGVPQYDAMFIPDSSRMVGYIVPTLAMMGTKDIQLLGISRWDDPALIERGGEYVEGAIFVDSFYKRSKESWVSTFVSKFNQAYGIDSTLLEALGYDTMRVIIAAVEEKGAKSRDMVKAAIARTANFPGVAGRISFDERGDTKRQLFVLTIRGGEIQEVE